MHGACAALPVITTLFCAGKRNCFTDAIQQSGARIDVKLMVLAVDPENHRNRSLDARQLRAC
jgi:hypothetical protein